MGILTHLTDQRQRGQGTTETLVLLPFFLVLIFGLLQLGQLATALLIANYAAAAAGREMVQNNNRNPGSYSARFDKLLAVGMKNPQLDVGDPEGDSIEKNITVHACADINAFPFVNEFFGSILTSRLGTGSGGCPALNLFEFRRSLPPAFVVHGKATVRLNYKG